MYECLINDSYKNSKEYKRLAQKMSKQFGIPIGEINKIVERRMGQLYPNLKGELLSK